MDYSQKITHSNLLQLIQDLQLEGKRFAVEHNHRIISKSQLQYILLQDQDCIEVIHTVGGG
ncbi:thiamine biosynthesis protein ThiS [Acinetobacter sp. ANC 4654]|uniref:sulfur carrier protein ThiS n=1 Tax=Acinetobacter sp. ANC 4654 TaxID=1977872 RepID=UPI000B65F14F|nr:sulfur carrier protein ThiS [Acinetobacter sp. ANC 4654]OTG92506.1 thiamine biosynthesis protein ThiS [Acinetobacter sp. ANC 4654]